MAIKHGVFVSEEATALTVPQAAQSDLIVAVGTAPVNTLDDPEAAANVPIVAYSFAEAAEQLGYSKDYGRYTLCGLMYAAANIEAVSPVVYINVLDPARHKKVLAETEITVSDMQGTLKKTGILRRGLVVKYLGQTAAAGAGEGSASGDGADLDGEGGGAAAEPVADTGWIPAEEGTDYVLGYDADGYLTVTLVSGGAAEGAAALKVSGYELAPEAVTKDDIIGAIDISTGKETGMEVIRQVFPKFGMVPGQLLAPGWSHIPEIGLALCAKAASVNTVFKAMAVLDLDTELARKYADVKEAKEACGYASEFSRVMWPMAKVGESIFPLSVISAVSAVAEDAANDDVPGYGSNIAVNISGACLSDGTEVQLDQDQAAAVNSAGVTTLLRMNGWRLWGNYTGAFPGSGDAKDIWWHVRRIFNWQGNTFIQTYLPQVDRPMSGALVQNIVNSENIRLSAYIPKHFAAAEISYNPDDNPATDVISGKMTFRQKIAPYTPAQEINDVLSYDVESLTAALAV